MANSDQMNDGNGLGHFLLLVFAFLNVGQADSIQEGALQAHNDYRAKHGCPPLVLHDEISTSAQKHAENLARIGRLRHQENGIYGENIYYYYTDQEKSLPNDSIIVNAAIKAWYDESLIYNYDHPGFSSATGHFSQLVWKTSKFLGIGLKRNSNENKVYVVAQYSPPGNDMNQGKFTENVPRAGLLSPETQHFITVFCFLISLLLLSR